MTWSDIYQMSALVGQDWRPKTFKELLIQWEAVLLESWSHTASIRGCFATKKVSLTDLHPYVKKAMSSTRIKIDPQKMFSFQKYRGGKRVSILDELIATVDNK